METLDKQFVDELKSDFEVLWCGKVQDLTELRRSNLSQSEMAFLSGKSIKTIQRFENYQTKDVELMYIYKSLLSNFKNKSIRRNSH